MRARYYDTDTGRFTRRDTYEGRLREPLTLHKYLYTNANPINFIDPTGLYTQAFGYAVEDAIQPEYRRDHPGNRISFGRWARPTPEVRLNIKPDILNHTTRRFNEIKPLNIKGISEGIAQLTDYFLELMPYGYQPDVVWHRPPDILQVLAQTHGITATPVLVFNVGGILFYTDQMSLRSEVQALRFSSFEQGIEGVKPLLFLAGVSAINGLAQSKFLIHTVQSISEAINFKILQSQIELSSVTKM